MEPEWYTGTDEILIPEPRAFPRWLAIATAVGIVAVGGGMVLWRTVQGSTPAQQYVTAPVQRTELADTIAATGPVAAARAVPLNFKNSGRVAEINVKVGDTAEAGQILARLDPTDFQAQLRQAQANLAAVEAKLEGMLAGPREEQTAQLQANLDTANQRLAAMQRGPRKETVAQAEASLKSTQAKLDQIKAGSSNADVAAAQTAVDQAAANGASAQAKLDQVKAGPTQADLAAAQGAADSAEAALKSAQAKLDQLKAGPTSSDIATAQAAVTQAKQALITAEDKYETAKGVDSNGNSTLAASGFSSVSAAQQNYNAAKASYDAAVQKLDQLQAGALPADAQAAQSAVDSAQANYAAAVAKLNDLKKGPQPADVTPAQSALDSAKAGLASAEARLAQIKAGPTQQELDQAQAAVDTAQAQLTLAQNPHTAEDIEQARSSVWAAEQALKLGQQPYSKQDIDSARAQVAAQQALVDLAQANLDAATLTAPSAGVVTALNGAVGQWLAGGSTSGAAASAASGANTSSTNSATTFISLTDLSNLQIQAQVNEADVGRLQPGQPVTFTVDAFPGQSFKGTVAAVQPLGSATQNVVSYPVLISIEPTEARLLPGMTANVTITVDKRPEVLVVPAAAISFAQAQAASGSQSGPAATTNGGRSVLLVDGEGRATVRPIQTGSSNGQYTEVVSGLEAGQLVAVGVRGN